MSRSAPRSSLRAIPSVDRILRELGEIDLPRPVVLAVVRKELDQLRGKSIRENGESRRSGARDTFEDNVRSPSPSTLGEGGGEGGSSIPSSKTLTPTLSRSTGRGGKSIEPRPPNADLPIVAAIRSAIDDLRQTRIQPVINGTGIIVHTNFGRAPLGPLVVQSLIEIAANYNTLEFDLASGERGNRGAYLEHNLAILCGSESATVVNNCAAALVLALRHFAATPPRNRVIISRGELVQIGGGFRIPEILEASGAELAEVGTTNKTNADDYRRAIDDRAAMILRVHQSNFYMEGFVESPDTRALAAVAREAGIPLVVDLGSGATFDTRSLGNEHEPTPADTLAYDADLVTFSGDKLLGGPQAGILAGSESLIAAIKKEPFFRALRCDKLILAAMQTTVDLLLGERDDEIPIRRMMSIPIDELQIRADRIVAALRDSPLRIAVSQGRSQIGGGSLPRTAIPTITLDFEERSEPGEGQRTFDLSSRLRRGAPPVIGYTASNRFKLDLRTIFSHQDEQLIAALRKVALPSSKS